MKSEDIQPAVKLLEPSPMATELAIDREKLDFEAMHPELLR